MLIVNKDEKSIYLTRGDAVAFGVTAEIDGEDYQFQAGDLVRFKVMAAKNCSDVIFYKDTIVTESTDEVVIRLTAKETKIGEIINKPVNYWYEVELNPLSPEGGQTIVGYDDNGAKILKLFPEGADV